MSGLGYAPRSTVASCTTRSSSSVVTPGRTARAASSRTSRPIRHAALALAISFSVRMGTECCCLNSCSEKGIEDAA